MKKLLFTLIILTLNQTVTAQAVLVFGSTGQPPLNTLDNDGFLDEVIREMVKRIGYQLQIKHLPTERSIHDVNQGTIDGDMSRVKGLEGIYKNIIYVPENIKETKFSVYSKKPLKLKSGWKSLANKKIAYIRGWKILDINVPNTAIITKTKNAQQMFELLNKDRVELVIYDQIRGIPLLDKLAFELIQLQSQSPILATSDMFICLNIKHKKLVPLLNQALLDMKEDGSYHRLMVKHLGVDLL